MDEYIIWETSESWNLFIKSRLVAALKNSWPCHVTVMKSESFRMQEPCSLSFEQRRSEQLPLLLRPATGAETQTRRTVARARPLLRPNPRRRSAGSLADGIGHLHVAVWTQIGTEASRSLPRWPLGGVHSGMGHSAFCAFCSFFLPFYFPPRTFLDSVSADRQKQIVNCAARYRLLC